MCRPSVTQKLRDIAGAEGSAGAADKFSWSCPGGGATANSTSGSERAVVSPHTVAVCAAAAHERVRAQTELNRTTPDTRRAIAPRKACGCQRRGRLPCGCCRIQMFRRENHYISQTVDATEGKHPRTGRLSTQRVIHERKEV